MPRVHWGKSAERGVMSLERSQECHWPVATNVSMEILRIINSNKKTQTVTTESAFSWCAACRILSYNIISDKLSINENATCSLHRAVLLLSVDVFRYISAYWLHIHHCRLEMSFAETYSDSWDIRSFSCLFVWDTVSLSSPGYSGTHYVDQAGLKLKRPTSAFPALVLQVCTSTPCQIPGTFHFISLFVSFSIRKMSHFYLYYQRNKEDIFAPMLKPWYHVLWRLVPIYYHSIISPQM